MRCSKNTTEQYPQDTKALSLSLRHNCRRGLGILIISLLAGLNIGCGEIDPHKGYTSAPLHPTDIETVCVQMFQSESFRREVEFELTSAVCRQIELRTPYKVVADAQRADTVLYGVITSISEKTLIHQRDLDRPLENQYLVNVKVTWKDLRTGRLILDNQKLESAGQYYPLLAESTTAATRSAVDDLAVRIVEGMEAPW